MRGCGGEDIAREIDDTAIWAVDMGEVPVRAPGASPADKAIRSEGAP